jgi:hypothetical protein
VDKRLCSIRILCFLQIVFALRGEKTIYKNVKYSAAARPEAPPEPDEGLAEGQAKDAFIERLRHYARLSRGVCMRAQFLERRAQIVGQGRLELDPFAAGGQYKPQAVCMQKLPREPKGRARLARAIQRVA